MALWRIRATVDDRPGYLSVLTASLALRGVNILTVQVHTTELGAVDDFLVDAPEALTEADLVAAVERGRGRNCWVARSEARGLADQPTRALGLASRLVRDPDALGEVLRSLLSAGAVTWRATSGPDHRGARGESMWLPDPAGGSFEVVRDAPSFTPAEYARAQALVDLAATVVRQAADQVTLVLPDGAELTVRPATGDDLPAVQAMHERCSARTRYRRYLSGLARPVPAQLRRLLEPAGGVSLVALAGGSFGEPERVVAMANLVAEGAMAELALLVEDAWQRRGVGSALLRRLVTHAGQAGYDALVAHTHADNVGMLRTLRRLGRPGPVDRDGNLLSVTVPVSLPGNPYSTLDARSGVTGQDSGDPAPLRGRAAGTA
jgi:GNAT superfamily N-acetyltransferase